MRGKYWCSDGEVKHTQFVNIEITCVFVNVLSVKHLLEMLGLHDLISSVDLSLCLFPFQSVPYEWCTECHGMYYPVDGIVHIKDSLLSFKD